MLKSLSNYYIKNDRNFNLRNIIAFFASFILHLVIVFLLILDFQKEDLQHSQKHGNQEKERVNIRDFKFVSPSKEIVVPPKNESLATKLPKQDMATPPTLPSKKEVKPKERKEIKPKEKKIRKVEPEAPQELQVELNQEDLPKSLVQEILPNKAPISSSPSIYSLGRETFNKISKEMQEIYGEDLHSLSLEEKQFLEANLKAIGRITQKYLKYPRIAGRTGQQGKNIIEFYLYPNGNISDLKLLTSSGYALLDKNSKQTVEIAYKDYPYPSVKTKIRIQINYRIHN